MDYRDEYMSMAMSNTTTNSNMLCGPPPKKEDYDYDDIDEFIATNTSNLYISSISCKFLREGKKIYNNLKNTQNQTPSYTIFGGSFGYTSYAIYKCKEQNIYLIKLNVQKIEDYVKLDVTNEKMFDL